MNSLKVWRIRTQEARGVCDWPDSILRGPYQGRVEFDCSSRPQGYYGSPVNGIDNVVYYCPGSPTPTPVPPGHQPGNTPPSLFTNDNSQQLYSQKQNQQQNLLVGRGEVPPNGANMVEKQVPKKIVCPASLQYNPSIGACDWPENAASNALFNNGPHITPDGNMLLHEQPPALQLQQLTQQQNTEKAENAHRMLMKMIADGDAKSSHLNNMDLLDNNNQVHVKFGYTRQPAFNAGLNATPRKGTLDAALTTTTAIPGGTTRQQLQPRFHVGNLVDPNDIFNNSTTDVRFRLSISS